MKELATNNKNVEQIYSDYSLDELLQFIKEQLKQSKEYEQDKNKNFVLNLIMPIFQRHNRYNSILIQLSIIKNNIKEIEAFYLSQRLIIEQKIEIEKLLEKLEKKNVLRKDEI